MRLIARILPGLAGLLLIFGCAAKIAESQSPDIAENSAAPSTKLVFFLDHVGPFVIGSRYSDVATTNKLKLYFSSETTGGPVEQPTGRGCETFGAGEAFLGVALMFEDGILTRIDYYDPDRDGPIKPMPGTTDKGARIGMTVDEVKAVYGAKLEQTPHPYSGEAGSYLRWQPNDESKYGIIFETEGAIVNSFRIGMVNSVQYIEGCL